MPNELPEVWLRGPVEGYAAELQPVVHALLQVREEVERHAADLTTEQLWARPGNAGSIGFHLRHIAGATDRLLTYARDESLTPGAADVAEGRGRAGPATRDRSRDHRHRPRRASTARSRRCGQTDVSDAARCHAASAAPSLPTTVIGLVFHAAEHARRHAGQIATMRKVVKGEAPSGRRDNRARARWPRAAAPGGTGSPAVVPRALELRHFDAHTFSAAMAAHAARNCARRQSAICRRSR